RFEANRGQTDARVRYMTHSGGYSLFLTPSEAVMVLRRGGAGSDKNVASRNNVKDSARGAVLRIRMLGANRSPEVSGLDALEGASNYLVGRDPSRWRTNVPSFARVLYKDVYPGVDLVYHGDSRQLEYDFRLAPGADPSRVRMSFAGAKGVSVDRRTGELVLKTAAGELRQRAPFAYQEAEGGARLAVESRYVVGRGGEVRFALGAYDRTRALVIDPTFEYFTYLGGSRGDQGMAIAVDSAGCAYVTGYASSTFPTTAGAFQTTFGGGDGTFGGGFDTDVFVTKLNPTGTGLVYSTYVGGKDAEASRDIAVDAAGNAYVVGNTFSLNFPTTPGAFRTALNNGVVGSGFFQNSDGFVLKLNPAGDALVYSTFLGGSDNSDVAFSVAVDADGFAYVAGDNRSNVGFPTTPGAYQTSPAGNGFVTKLNQTGTGLIYSTFIGVGSVAAAAHGIAIDAAGNAYVTGGGSEGFPVTPGAFQTTYAGNFDAYVLKLNPSGSALVYSTLVGGSVDEAGNDIAVDAAGNAYVNGQTKSADFPVTPGAFQTAHTNPAQYDTFAFKLNPAGSALVYSTFLGGSGPEEAGESLALDSSGDLYLTGSTGSAAVNGFAVTFPLKDTLKPYGGGGNGDPFVTVLDPTGSTLLFSSFLGGNGNDIANGIAIDPSRAIYVTGLTGSTNLPTTPGAYLPTHNAAGGDAFVAKIGPVAAGDTTPPSISCPAPVNVSVEPGSCSAVVNYAANASDDRPGVTVTYNPPSGSVFPVGATTVTATATDAAGNNASCSFDVTVRDDQPPVISCPADINVEGNIQGSCGANVGVTVPPASDSCSDVAVSALRSDGQAVNAPYPQGVTTITWTATDASGNAVSCQQRVTVTNPAPSVNISSPASGSVYPVGAPVNFAGAYTDNAGGTHAAVWTFGAVTQAGSVDEQTGAVTASHVFTEPGVYSVNLTVDDGCGGSGTATTVGEFEAMVVVYDPAEGFVTGGGWINSQAGAYTAAPGATGKANFGFNAKYLPNSNAPAGQTEFQLKAANLNFHSTAYEWLVVSGARAQYRGTGTVNGGGLYGFTVTVIDGDQPGGDRVDRFRIKIWDKATGAIVYDNQPGAPSSADPAAPLGSGEVVIHH
ncbi:MAG TPA: SBBP repeat-containing protein, partial [Pyrinomonadaceae bacterium]|nr:SBBP repeat-containing protein [Pyrinomonadaceae bacterium]